MRRHAPGFTLLEVMVALAIIGIIVGLVYGTFAGTAESKEEIETGNDIYHEARWALDKLEADLSSAYLSRNANSETLFYGLNRDGAGGLPVDELHFNSFNHFKFNPTAQESDQCEISYFLMENPDTGVLTLYRREDATPDEDPMEGGEFYELAEGVLAFNLRYFDGYDWLDDWDSRNFEDDEEVVETDIEQTDEMIEAIPVAVEVTLIMQGPREAQIAFHTKIRILLSSISLSFADEEDEGEDTGGGDDDDDDKTSGGSTSGSISR